MRYHVAYCVTNRLSVLMCYAGIKKKSCVWWWFDDQTQFCHAYEDTQVHRCIPHPSTTKHTHTKTHPLMWSLLCDPASSTEKQLCLASRWNGELCRWIRQQRAGCGYLDNPNSLILCVFPLIAGQQRSLIKTLAPMDSNWKEIVLLWFQMQYKRWNIAWEERCIVLLNLYWGMWRQKPA